MPRKTQFTIYDAMEQNGAFSGNPANAGARDNDGNPLFTGPVPYPKMLYHPEGEEYIVTPVEVVVTPLGPREHNEQKALIHKIVNNEAEEAEAVAEGWLDHPAKAMRVRVEAIIANSKLTDKETKALLAKIPKLPVSANKVAELEAEIAALKKLRAEEAA